MLCVSEIHTNFTGFCDDGDDDDDDDGDDKVRIGFELLNQPKAPCKLLVILASMVVKNPYCWIMMVNKRVKMMGDDLRMDRIGVVLVLSFVGLSSPCWLVFLAVAFCCFR